MKGIPQISWHTMKITGQYVPVPTMGAVYAGMGMVYKNCTHGIPMWNPTHHTHGEGLGSSSGGKTCIWVVSGEEGMWEHLSRYRCDYWVQGIRDGTATGAPSKKSETY